MRGTAEWAARALLALAAAVAAGAGAQGTDRAAEPRPPRPTLALAVRVERLVAAAADGEEGASAPVLEPVTGALAAGDELLYTVSFENVGGAPASDVRITQPLPDGVRYVPGTAVGPGAVASYSADGGRTFGAPEELTAPAGGGMRRPAEAGDYTHIRWRLPGTLAPGAKGFLRFRAVVQGDGR
ncbi:MAG TPA: hypothetical protein VIN61_17160 [Gammaproteobacteria bacterium]